MTTLTTLPERLDKRFKQFEKNVDTRGRNIALGAHVAAASGTPADTGEARSNWRMTAAAVPPSGQIPAYAPGKHLGINETQNLAVAVAQGKRVAARWKASQGKPIHLFNNWSQIERLNSGEISQQGSHFVERARAKMIQLTKLTKWLDR